MALTLRHRPYTIIEFATNLLMKVCMSLSLRTYISSYAFSGRRPTSDASNSGHSLGLYVHHARQVPACAIPNGIVNLTVIPQDS